MKFHDLSGLKFGRLTVISRTANHVASSGREYTQYLCRCDCGNTCIALSQDLTSGKKTNCGCLTGKLLSEATTLRNTKHGDAHRIGKRNRLYQLWIGIKRRCYNKNDKSYVRYGGKGISVCEEWLNSYENFKEWALANGYDINAPRGVCTIDRIDSSGDYCPENCRFVSYAVQGDNRNGVIHITYNGETHNLSQWANILGIKRTTLLERYKKGFRDEMLFSTDDLRTHKNN